MKPIVSTAVVLLFVLLSTAVFRLIDTPRVESQPATTNHAPSLQPCAVRECDGDQKHTEASAGAKRVSTETLRETQRKLQAWLASSRDSETLSEANVRQGIKLAKERKAALLELMGIAPEKALEFALSWSEYKNLPAEIKPHTENLFSERGDFMVFPVCAGSAPEGAVSSRVYQVELEDGRYGAAVFGRLERISTKKNTPLQGFTLEGMAVVRSAPLQRLSQQDADSVSGDFPVANHDAGKDFATGDAIHGQPVVALGGGMLFYFSTVEHLDATNRRLMKLDQLPGPDSGAQAVFLQASGGDGTSQGVDWQQLESSARMQASSWTETPKKVFFIRVDFSDEPGASTSQVGLEDRINGPVSASIEEMSYGKTSLDADVSSMVVRLPQPASYYAPSDNSGLYNDAIAAFEAIPATGIDLGDYDIVGVHFANIGMSGGSFSYAGLATVGGSRQWLQGTINAGVIIHEFGHNYGLSHANFWDAGSSSVVGPGVGVNYGNIYDIMGSGPDPEGHFHPQGKKELNWLAAGDWLDASAAGSGTYRLFRGDHPATTGIRGIRIDKNAGINHYYWLGFRKNFPGNRTLDMGAVMNWEKSGQSYLLDTTPGSAAGKDDAALTLGRTYSDGNAHVHITPVAAGGSSPDEWIDVTVNLGPFPGNTAPTLTLNGPASGEARSGLVFTADAADADGDTLAYAWDFGDGKVEANSYIVSHAWNVAGTYTVSLTVSDMKGGTVTKTMNVTVTDPLDHWTQRTSGTSAHLYDIVYGEGKLVTVGASNGTYRVSTDGSSWTGGTLSINVSLKGVAHDGSQFVAVGQDYDFSINDWVGVIYTSPDGTTWTLVRREGERLRDVVYAAGAWIATGDNGTILRSITGSSWASVSSGVNTNLHGVSYGDGGFVIVGANSSSQGGTVLTSTDGLTWFDTSAAAGTSQGFFTVEYVLGKFLAGGFYTKIRYSTDGGTSFQTNRQTQERIEGFTHGNGVILAIGTDLDNGGPSGTPDINLVSIDGTNWSKLPTASQPDREAVVFFQNTFVTVGENGSIRQSAVIPAATGWAAWQQEHFPGSPANSGANDDFDGDGIDNLSEYATGTNPRDGNDHNRPVYSEESGYATLTLTKSGEADVIYEIQTSDDLTDWSDTGTVVVTDNASVLKVRLATPTSDPALTRKFLRAKFTLIP